MVVFDCCPFRHAPFVKRPAFRSQDVVLLFDVIVTTNGHVPPLLSSRPSIPHWMHRVVYACVGVSFDRVVRTCGHAVRMLFSKHHPSGNRDLDESAVGTGA